MSDPKDRNTSASASSAAETTAQDVAHNEPVPVMTPEETALASGADPDAVLGAGADPGDAPAHSAEVPAAAAPEPGIYLQLQHEGDEDVMTLELRTDSKQTLKELVYDAIAAHHSNPTSFLGRAITTVEGLVLSEGLSLLENEIKKGDTIKIVGLPK